MGNPRDAAERVEAFVSEWQRRCAKTNLMGDTIHGLGLGDGEVYLNASDLRTVLEERGQRETVVFERMEPSPGEAWYAVEAPRSASPYTLKAMEDDFNGDEWEGVTGTAVRVRCLPVWDEGDPSVGIRSGFGFEGVEVLEEGTLAMLSGEEA